MSETKKQGGYSEEREGGKDRGRLSCQHLKETVYFMCKAVSHM